MSFIYNVNNFSCRCFFYVCVLVFDINSFPPCAAYMRKWIRSSLVHVTACHLFGTKPSPEPMMTFCEMDPQEQTSVKFQ